MIEKLLGFDFTENTLSISLALSWRWAANFLDYHQFYTDLSDLLHITPCSFFTYCMSVALSKY